MINLLPQKEKEFLIQEEQLRIVLVLGILFLALLVFLALALFLINTYILRQIDLGQAKISLEDGEFKNSDTRVLKEKVSFFNQELLKLDAFFEDQVSLTSAISKISQTLPSGVYLSSLSYQKDTEKISLSGFCPTREVLFELKKNLESEEKIKELDFPPSNWAKPKDIEFHLNFKIEK